ncbi:Regulation of nuclear pre-mRNA domain-containing protein 1A [Conglomerata obtusa]
MSTISPEFFIRSLQCLSPNQEEIQTLALFIYTHKNDYRIILEILKREYDKSNINHRLTLIYLSDEIVILENTSEPCNLIRGLKLLLPYFYSKANAMGSHYCRKKLLAFKQAWIDNGICKKEEFETNFRQKDADDYGRSALLERVNKYFDKKEEFIEYLKEFIRRNEIN